MNIKKIFILSIICILIFIIVTTLFKDKNKFHTYLALGDSIAEGYALSNLNDRYSNLVKNNYNIKSKNFINLSKSGMTAKELSIKIKDDNYINAIKNADLITISIGSNELLRVFTNILQDVYISNNNNNLIEFANKLARQTK